MPPIHKDIVVEEEKIVLITLRKEGKPLKYESWNQLTKNIIETMNNKMRKKSLCYNIICN